MKKNAIHWRIRGFFLLLLLAGCASVEVISTSSQPALDEKELKVEVLDMRNCVYNTTEINTTLEAEAPVRQQMIIEEQAVSIDTGDIIDIPMSIHNQLEKEITNQYREYVQTAQSNAEQVALTIPPSYIRMYSIRWIQQSASATITFHMENQTYEAEYTYQLEYPELIDWKEMRCTA
jgi:hypothetical protein